MENFGWTIDTSENDSGRKKEFIKYSERKFSLLIYAERSSAKLGSLSLNEIMRCRIVYIIVLYLY